MLQGSSFKDQWTVMRSDSTKKMLIVQGWLEKYEGLLDVIDGLIKPPAESLYSKMKKMLILNKEIHDFYKDKVSDAEMNERV